MSQSCQDCTCSSPATAQTGGHLLLATQLDHTATALRSLALRKGQRLRLLAPGLLSLDATADDVATFVADARAALSSIEAEEVRCVVVDGSVSLDAVAFARALTAPSLAAAGARVAHADLVPMFADELACFHAVYQPIVDLADGGRIGYESLLRATTPGGRPVMPELLFAAAEDAGWTNVLDRVGRTTALHDAGPWLGEDLLFINFVPTSIYRPEVCLRTTEIAADKAGVRLDQLVFEVTESQRIRDLDHLQRVFDYYRSRDCKVALDDIGSGYSSLNTLVRLQPDIVKLDKDLVQSLPGTVGSAVVSAIVDITHSYGGLVLAECVETQEQADVARALGVDLGQGWLFGRPERPTPTDALSTAVGRPVDPALPDAAIAVVVPVRAPAGDAAALGPAVGPVTGWLTVEPVKPAEPVGARAADMSDLLVRAVDAGVGAVVVVDVLAPDSPLIYVNPAFEAATGYSAGEVIGRNCRVLQGPGTDMAAVRELAQAVREGREHRSVLLNYRKDGSTWWNELQLSPVTDDSSRLTHYLGFQNNVTDRVETEQQLLLLAARDSLTGLANRSTLIEHLDSTLALAAREQGAVAVLFVDLDGFKQVNDSFGHEVGDRVLVDVAQRVRAALRSGDLLARTGGDEFVAVLGGLDPLDAARIARRAADDLAANLRRPFVVGAVPTRVSGSVGIALYPDDALTGDRLLAAADADMYRVRDAGRMIS